MLFASFMNGNRIARALGVSFVANNGSFMINYLIPYALVLLATCALLWLAYLGYRKVRSALGKV